ncbi:thioredoxin family protein [Prosthecobacter sp. SYSU 5D2]|uniref:thioredoxin family protein n=1 Tax=Prosthecobacter sp. SYSU 5D2 TaxID=3134134 RepID=UPI0031FF3C6C
MRFFFLLLAGAVWTASLSAAPRDWTNTEGKTVSATFVEAVVDAAGEVTGTKVRLASGQIFTLELNKLSETDREFVATAHQEKQEAEKKARLASRRAKWTEDWEKAKQESEQTGLPILLLMTGSDWCGYCVRLKDNVFEDRAFQKFANENVVLMKADFPRAAQSKSLKEQNAKLKTDFPFGGYPTVKLVKDGREIATFGGYGGDTPEEYIEKLSAKLR